MILIDLKNTIRDHRAVSLGDLMRRYDMDAEALKPMVEHWVRKGKVEVHPSACTDKGCSGCATRRTETYVWKG